MCIRDRIASDGIEGALAAGDRSAEAEAQADRVALIELQGEDVNPVEQTVAMIRKRWTRISRRFEPGLGRA